MILEYQTFFLITFLHTVIFKSLERFFSPI